MEHEEKTKKAPILDKIIIRIPDCCREGREDCPHSVPRQKLTKKKNVGL